MTNNEKYIELKNKDYKVLYINRELLDLPENTCWHQQAEKVWIICVGTFFDDRTGKKEKGVCLESPSEYSFGNWDGDYPDKPQEIFKIPLKDFKYLYFTVDDCLNAVKKAEEAEEWKEKLEFKKQNAAKKRKAKRNLAHDISTKGYALSINFLYKVPKGGFTKTRKNYIYYTDAPVDISKAMNVVFALDPGYPERKADQSYVKITKVSPSPEYLRDIRIGYSIDQSIALKKVEVDLEKQKIKLINEGEN